MLLFYFFTFFIVKSALTYPLPWLYTSVFGHPYQGQYHVTGIIGNDRKFCLNVTLAGIDDARICAQNVFANAYPRKLDRVILMGKQSMFGISISKGILIGR